MNSKIPVYIILICILLTQSSCAIVDPKYEKTVIENNTPLVDNSGITKEDMGIETSGGLFSPLIEKGSPSPTQKAFTVSTDKDNQDRIRVFFYRGHDKVAKGNKYLGTYEIVGIQPLPKGQPQIQIVIGVSERQIWMNAVDAGNAKAMRIKRLK